MSEMTMVPCSACGAGLLVPPDQSEAICSYCGEATTIEPGRFSEHRERATEAREAEAEGQEAL